MLFPQSAPPSTMYGTLAMVPTLLTTVGLAYRPAMAGNGGRRGGWPRIPPSEVRKAGLAAEALERVEQRGLLTADVRAGARVHHDVQVEPGVQDVRAEIALRVRLVDRAAQPAGRVHRLAADVDERPVGADRVRRDDDALDQRVRVV